MTDQRTSAVTDGIQLELGEVTDGDGKPLDYEAIIFFAGMYDSPEIRVNAPNAQAIAKKIVELWNGVPAQEQPEPRWTEDELALAFFDYSACTKARCAFKRVGGCHCVTVAYQAVNMIKHVLPRSFPLASTVPSTDGSTPEASHG